MDVGWTLINDDKYSYEKPKSLRTFTNKKYKDSTQTNCMGINDLSDRIFVIESPWDIRLKYDNKKITLIKEESSISQEYFMEIIGHRYEEYTENVVIQLGTSYVFMTDKPCTITALPAFYHMNETFRLISGQWNIFDWQRPLGCAYEWLDTTKDFIIKKGDPLQYIMFNSQNMDEKYNLKYMETDDMKKQINYCMKSRYTLIKGLRHLVLKSRHERKKDIVGKCPFHKMKFW